MKADYLTRISEGVILFDGAMGTMLYDRGIFINRCFEEINIANPEMVTGIYREYIEPYLGIRYDCVESKIKKGKAPLRRKLRRKGREMIDSIHSSVGFTPSTHS